MKNKKMFFSSLNHTWIIDLDGTVLKHNGYLLDGIDSLLPGAIDFLNSIPPSDFIIFLSSRNKKYRGLTISFLKKNNIHFNKLILGVPFGERVLINDNKRSGLKTGYVFLKKRDSNDYPTFMIDNKK